MGVADAGCWPPVFRRGSVETPPAPAPACWFGLGGLGGQSPGRGPEHLGERPRGGLASDEIEKFRPRHRHDDVRWPVLRRRRGTYSFRHRQRSRPRRRRGLDLRADVARISGWGFPTQLSIPSYNRRSRPEDGLFQPIDTILDRIDAFADGRHFERTGGTTIATPPVDIADALFVGQLVPA